VLSFFLQFNKSIGGYEMGVYVVMSHNGQNVKEVEIEFITTNESLADDYVQEMDDCCTQGRVYWAETWEVEE
jgi:hypothetical protein